MTRKEAITELAKIAKSLKTWVSVEIFDHIVILKNVDGVILKYAFRNILGDWELS